MKPKSFYEIHSGKLQFFINLCLFVVTLSAVIISSYYSKKGLELSTQQYNSAIRQFNYQRRLDSIKNVADSIKEINIANRRKNDSVVQMEKDKLQSTRNKKQDILNDRQLDINKQQLIAIKRQVQTLQGQLDEQVGQNKQQLLEKRPFFAIDNINIDSSNTYKNKISFIFTNKGIRTAHVDGTILAFFNLRLGCASITPDRGNLDAPSQSIFLKTSEISIYHDCLNSPQTVYFLLIYYKDFATNESKIEPIFFKYFFTKDKQFFYSRLQLDQIPIEFKNFLKKKGIS